MLELFLSLFGFIPLFDLARPSIAITYDRSYCLDRRIEAHREVADDR